MSEERKDQIKPIAIWTVLLTGIILSLLKVFGDGFLMTHDINVKYPFLEEDIAELKTMHIECEKKMDMILLDTHSHHNKLDAFEHRIRECEEDMDNCEAAHRKYHHGIKK